MRRPLLLVAAALVAAIAWWALSPGRNDAPRPGPASSRPDDPGAATEPAVSPTPTQTTAPLVVRVKTSDGREVPAGARAGFTASGRAPRLRPADVPNEVRFLDAPFGLVTALAEAEGFDALPSDTLVQAGLPNEAVVVLRPRPPK